MVQRESAKLVVYYRIDKQLRVLSDNIDFELKRAVDDVNRLSSQIAALNGQILSTEGVSIGTSNELRDQRDRALDELSELMDVFALEKPNGVINVSGSERSLVTSNFPAVLEVIVQNNNGNFVSDIFDANTGEQFKVRDGNIAALVEARNEVIPKFRGLFDELAKNLIDSANNIHKIGVGLKGTNSAVPKNNLFFTGNSSVNIELAQAIVDDVNNIAAARRVDTVLPSGEVLRTGSPGDNTIAIKIADLKQKLILSDGTESLIDFFNTITENFNKSRERLTDLQEQLSTGKRLSRPSDDLGSMANAMRLRTILESNIQFQNNIGDGLTQLTAQEEALNQIYDILVGVKEIAIEGASDSITIRDSLAQQLDLMLDNLAEIANSKFNNKYLFGGTETQSAPFALNQNVINGLSSEPVSSYRGNNGKINRQINDQTTVEVNLTGKEIFDQPTSGVEDIFQLIFDLKGFLETDDTSGINGKIENVNGAIEQTLQNFLKIGTRKQLITFNDDRYISQNIQVQSALSSLEDTDFGEAFIAFKAEENALNSALSAGARVVSPSLIDFLGVG